MMGAVTRNLTNIVIATTFSLPLYTNNVLINTYPTVMCGKEFFGASIFVHLFVSVSRQQNNSKTAGQIFTNHGRRIK